MTDKPGARPPIPDRPLLRGERVWLRPLETRDCAPRGCSMANPATVR
jgi:hypothetical protein